MRSVFVSEKTLDSTWFKLLSELWLHGRRNKIDYGSFAGSNRLEFDFVAGTIEFPTARPLAPIMPDGVPPVTTDDEIEHYFTTYLMDGKNLALNEHYRYSTWIAGGKYRMPHMDMIVAYNIEDDGSFSQSGHKGSYIMNVPNQVEWVIKHYKEKGFGNNHCYIQVGYPESSFAYDQPWENESERQTSPCLRGIDTHIKDDVLHMSVTFRSWDLFAGFPENMGGMVYLMEYIANELNIETGPLSFSCLKLHCYDSQMSALKARLNID
jgi:thymidylate synthase